MQITIVTTSVSGKKKMSLLAQVWYHGRYLLRRYEIGQKVKTNEVTHWNVGAGKRGKIIGFNRPNCDGIRDQVLKVLLDGENEPRNLRTDEIMLDRGW